MDLQQRHSDTDILDILVQTASPIDGGIQDSRNFDIICWQSVLGFEHEIAITLISINRKIQGKMLLLIPALSKHAHTTHSPAQKRVRPPLWHVQASLSCVYKTSTLPHEGGKKNYKKKKKRKKDCLRSQCMACCPLDWWMTVEAERVLSPLLLILNKAQKPPRSIHSVVEGHRQWRSHFFYP